MGSQVHQSMTPGNINGTSSVFRCVRSQNNGYESFQHCVFQAQVHYDAHAHPSGHNGSSGAATHNGVVERQAPRKRESWRATTAEQSFCKDCTTKERAAARQATALCGEGTYQCKSTIGSTCHRRQRNRNHLQQKEGRQSSKGGGGASSKGGETQRVDCCMSGGSSCRVARLKHPHGHTNAELRHGWQRQRQRRWTPFTILDSVNHGANSVVVYGDPSTPILRTTAGEQKVSALGLMWTSGSGDGYQWWTPQVLPSRQQRQIQTRVGIPIRKRGWTTSPRNARKSWRDEYNVFITKNQTPEDRRRDSTYTHIVCDVRPHKENLNRVWITAGGSKKLPMGVCNPHIRPHHGETVN